MTLTEYREKRGISQKKLAEELKEVCPGIDRVLISKIESGLVEPNEAVTSYISKTANEACAHPVGERKSDGRYIYHSEEKISETGDFDPIEEMVLGALKVSSKDRPLTRASLKDLTGLKDSRARDIIGRLRDKGYRVVGSAGTKGYWIAETESEYLAFRREYQNKAMTYLSRIQAMDRYTEGQVRMD